MPDTFMDLLSTCALKFSHQDVIIPLVVIGYIWLSRDIFYSAICLVLLSMLWNIVLKSTFKVPLASHLGKEGYAFPSGHMQLSTVLYGWLIYKIPQKGLRTGLGVLIGFIGFSLIHKGYHNLIDILGALVTAALLITIYVTAQKKVPVKYFPYFLLAFATAALGSMGALHTSLPPHGWLAFYALMGFVLADHMRPSETRKPTTVDKMLSTLLTLGIIFGLQMIFTLPVMKTLPPFLKQLPWFAIGLSLPLCPQVVHYFRKAMTSPRKKA